jgi:glycosyltransferase involved in cell wall biosynthesis
MKKKLLIFHPALAPYRVDQFNYLSQLFDLEVVFILENVPGNEFDQDKLLSLLNFKYAFLLAGPLYKDRVFRFGILKTIRRFNPDIILSYEYSFITQYLILLKRLGLIHQKIGSTTDDNLEICNHVQTKIRYVAREISIRRLDYLIVQSKEVSQFFIDRFKLNDNQLTVSPIFQDPVRLRSNFEELESIANGYLKKYSLKGKKVLLFVGRLVPEKAMKGFLNNIYHILLDQDCLVLILIGEGVERRNIEELIKEKNLQDKVFLPGRFEGQQLNAWYLCSSGFILPSVYEPFGAVVNEALIFGLKVFCSKYAGASYLINDEKGMLFDPSSEQDANYKLNLFLKSIDPVIDINMKNKPSLMSNNQQDFNNEWEKLNR